MVDPDNANQPQSNPVPGEDPLDPIVRSIRERLASIADDMVAATPMDPALEEKIRRVEKQIRESLLHEVEIARQRLRNRSTELNAYARELNRRREQVDGQLIQRVAQIEQDQKAIDEVVAKLQARKDEQERVEQELQRRMEIARDEIAESRVDVETRQDEVLRRVAELDQRQAKLEELETRLDRQSIELSELRSEAERNQKQSQADLKEASRLREDVETRDAQLREASLEAELERQELDAERQRLELQTPEPTFDEDLTVESETPAIVTAIAPGWKRRVAIVALCASVSAAIGVWLIHSPMWTARTNIVLETQRKPKMAAVVEHVANLQNPDVMRGVLDDPEMFAAWRDAVEDQNIVVHIVGDGDELIATTRARQAGASQKMLRQFVGQYCEAVNAGQIKRVGTPFSGDLTDRYAAIVASRDALNKQIAENQAALETLPNADTFDQLVSEARTLRVKNDQLNEQISDTRLEFERLSHLEPKGTVDPEVVETELSEDIVFQNDKLEFVAAARRYHAILTNVIDAMASSVDESPAVSIALCDKIQQQRELQPPIDIAKVLEDFDVKADRLNAHVEKLVSTWPNITSTLDGLMPADDMKTMIDTHNAAIDGVQSVVDEATRLSKEMMTQAEHLAESDGSTRHVVVANELRSAAKQLATAFDVLAEAAKTINFTDNFELDTQSRQVRRLRVVLDNRKEAIRRELQAAADEQAATKLEEQITATRQQLAVFEEQHKAGVRQIVKLWDDSEKVRSQIAQRTQLEAQQTAAKAESNRLQQQLTKIKQTLAEQGRATSADRLRFEATSVQTAIAVGKYRNVIAAATGVVVFVVVWLGGWMATRRRDEKT